MKFKSFIYRNSFCANYSIGSKGMYRCGFCNKFLHNRQHIWTTEGAKCPHCKVFIYIDKVQYENLLGTKEAPEKESR